MNDRDDLAYLRRNWSDAYVIVRPGQHDGMWRAVATFGAHDELVSDTADGLLHLIRRHYGPETEGYPFQVRVV